MTSLLARTNRQPAMVDPRTVFTSLGMGCLLLQHGLGAALRLGSDPGQESRSA